MRYLLLVVRQGQVVDNNWCALGRGHRQPHRHRLSALERPSPPTRAAVTPSGQVLLQRIVYHSMSGRDAHRLFLGILQQTSTERALSPLSLKLRSWRPKKVVAALFRCTGGTRGTNELGGGSITRLLRSMRLRESLTLFYIVWSGTFVSGARSTWARNFSREWSIAEAWLFFMVPRSGKNHSCERHAHLLTPHRETG